MTRQVKHVRKSCNGKLFSAGKRKKTFYWKYNKQTVNRTYGGSHAVVSVYKNSSNGLEKLGETDWDTRSYKGDNSEVFTFLHNVGEIPEKMWKAQNGYYTWSLAEKYGIKIEELT